MDNIQKNVQLEFEQAIKNKDSKTIVSMITQNNQIVNTSTAEGVLFINLALSVDFQIATLLINNGANINQVDKLGLTPIYNLIKNIETFVKFEITAEDIITMFQLIIDKGAQLNIQDRRGNTPINYIAQRAKNNNRVNNIYTKIGRLLLAFDPDVSTTVQIKNNMGKSPLDYLSRNGNFILRDAVFTKLPHVQDAINRTMAKTEAATKKILDTIS